MAKFTKTNKAIHHDGTIDFTDNQSMGGDYTDPNSPTVGNRMINAAPGEDDHDYIIKKQTFPRIGDDDPRTVSGVFTVYVSWLDGDDVNGAGTIGNKFKTPNRAFEWLNDYFIDVSVVVNIVCDAGHYELNTINITHPNADRIQIFGDIDNVPLQISTTTSIVVSLNTLNKSYDISLSIVGPSINFPLEGDMILINNIWGTVNNDENNVMIYGGAYKVTNVQGNVVSFTYRINYTEFDLFEFKTNPTPMTNEAGTKNIYVLRTVFNTTSTVISITNNTLKFINNIGFYGDGGGYGIRTVGSHITIGSRIAINNFYHGVSIELSSYCVMQSNGTEGFGISACVGGITARRSSTLITGYGNVSACAWGILSYIGSTIEVTSVRVSNCDKGIKSASLSSIGLNHDIYVRSCHSGATAQGQSGIGIQDNGLGYPTGYPHILYNTEGVLLLENSTGTIIGSRVFNNDPFRDIVISIGCTMITYAFGLIDLFSNYEYTLTGFAVGDMTGIMDISSPLRFSNDSANFLINHSGRPGTQPQPQP